jgi:hypothetical protein
MPDEFSQNDPRKVWQSQPTESSIMTPEKIRQKVRNLDRRTRRQLLGNLAVALVAPAFYGLGLKRVPQLVPLLVFAFAWSLAGLYFVNRRMWPRAMPEVAGLNTGIEAYRRAIERRRYLIRRTLLWSFGPVILVIGAFIAGLAKLAGDRSLFPNALPFLSLVVIWIVAYFIIRMREQRELQREIDELREIEKGG